MTLEELLTGLLPFLTSQTGASSATVRNLRQMTGGAVREIWSFDAEFEWPNREPDTQRLVLRAFSPAMELGLGPEGEFRLLRAVYREGVPVPEPLYLGLGVLSRDFYVMQRVDGETIGRRLVKDDKFAQARSVLPMQLAEALVRIHRFPVGTYELTFLRAPPEDKSPAETELQRLEGQYREITLGPHPAYELAFRWLWSHLPRVGERTLLHGDYRVGNFICGPEGLRAILDWERAHVGDPMEDIAWMCVRSWRFGIDHLEMGGIATRQSFFDAYEGAGGIPVDHQRVRFWEVFGNVRWGLTTLRLVNAFLNSSNRDLEWAAIGRRTAETEWEVLNLIEGL